MTARVVMVRRPAPEPDEANVCLTWLEARALAWDRRRRGCTVTVRRVTPGLWDRLWAWIGTPPPPSAGRGFEGVPW